MDNLLVVYGIDMAINTAPEGAAQEVWSPFGKGFNNLAESLNEVVQQYFFLSDGGYARNFVTGMAPALTLSGVRILGDPAQDYIFGSSRKYGLMAQRNTQLRIQRLTPDAKIETITCEVTLCNLSDMAGASTDGSAVSVEVRINGKPAVATANSPA